MSLHRSLLLLGAGAAAASASVLHLWLFSDGSLNNDEVAYLLQAQALADGRVFVPVIEPADASRPWFFAERPVGWVSKYLPLVAGLQAVGLRLTGSVVPVLAVLAALVPLVVARLAQEVGLDRRDQRTAAALVTLSPVVVMQSALPLSYVPFLVLVSTGWLLGLRLGLAQAGARTAAALGFVAVLAACARPYDSVLLLSPLLLWAAWQRRQTLPQLVPALLAGALPPVSVVLTYNARATGSALTLPFGLLEPSDTLGYGLRRMVPELPRNTFGPLEGIHGLLLHFGVHPLHWYSLGAVLVPAAVLSWRRAPAAARVLLVAAAVQLTGYAVFWGPWNFSVVWTEGTRVLGPIYAVPLLVPVVLAGLPVLRGWLVRWRGVRWLTAAAAAVAMLQLASAVQQAVVDEARTDEVLAVAERGRVADVVALDVDPPYLGHPVSRLVDGTVLSGFTPVPAAGAPVPALLQLPSAVYGRSPLTYALTRRTRVEGPWLPLSVTLVGGAADVLVVERAGRATACAADLVVGLRLTVTGTTGCDAVPVPERWRGNEGLHCEDTTCLVFAVYRHDDEGELRRRTWRRLPVDTRAASVATVVDSEPVATRGRGWLRVGAG